MAEVAEEALVSRATAYRYFSSVESLLVEASVDVEVPDPELLFDGDGSGDPVERVDRAEEVVHRVTFANEISLRHMLAHTVLARAHAERLPADGPVRQNRRIPLIEAALAPARNRLSDEGYDRLRSALALLFGPEAMIVFLDVLEAGADEARATKRWAIRALVSAALEESASAT